MLPLDFGHPPELLSRFGWGQLEPGLLLPYPCRGGQLSPWRQIPNLPSPGCMSPADFPLGNWGQVRKKKKKKKKKHGKQLIYSAGRQT
uniref:Uncharacterized protein n=1 Tax=Anas zonorhyncha TaxID=75864 RepID=A0A8B9VL33_9AVES